MALVAQSIFKKVLLNGLVVLVRPVHDIPKVSLQLSYHVGSKDEASGEKGLAHLIEHMMFKGTKKLSEADWAAITQKLSGYTNAFTYYDSTWYVFDVPSHHWKEPIHIYADTMRNCRFDEQMLNSEMKVVIQELKRARDNNFQTLAAGMIGMLFEDHPYHYPVIGFKQDLWNLKRDTLFNFYKKHYVPNNAVLVVVGDVDPEEVFAEAEKTLGKIPRDNSYQRKEFYHGRDLVARSLVFRRDVEQPYGLFAFVLPGEKSGKILEMELLSIILGGGRSSRLHKKIIDDQRLATEFATFLWGFEDASMLGMYFCADNEANIEKIRALIVDELHDIAQNGANEKELARALKIFKTNLLSTLESNAKQAQLIAESYLFCGDENLPFQLLAAQPDGLNEKIKELVKEYCYPAVMNSGKILSLSDGDKARWQTLQNLSDQEDARILDGRVRHTPLEEPRYVHKIKAKNPKEFRFHKPDKFTLSNGLRIFALHSTNIPKIEIALTLHARDHFDSEQKPGLYSFLSEMMLEGTKNYPGHSFMKELEDYAIGIDCDSGVISISVLREDLPKALEMLRELLTEAAFEEKAMEKVRAQLLARLRMFWDEPTAYASHLVKERLYEGHPYSKKKFGTEESLNSITRQDLQKFYDQYCSAYKARLSIVGDLGGYDIKQLLEKELGSWNNKHIHDQVFPGLKEVSSQVVSREANKDQVVLVLAGLSVPRNDPDYEKLLLFDQMLSGSMVSHLFQLRERSSLFYEVRGSLVKEVNEEPGMVYIYAIVSVDKLEEAKKEIRKTLENTIDAITNEELEAAKKALINEQVNWFSRNAYMANTFLYVDRYKLGDDYFDLRPDRINAVTLDEVKSAARKVLVPGKMLTLQIGRVGQSLEQADDKAVLEE